MYEDVKTTHFSGSRGKRNKEANNLGHVFQSNGETKPKGEENQEVQEGRESPLQLATWTKWQVLKREFTDIRRQVFLYNKRKYLESNLKVRPYIFIQEKALHEKHLGDPVSLILQQPSGLH